MDTLTFHIITIFPEFFVSPLTTGLFKKAVEKGILDFRFIDLREFGVGKHREIDGKPYGGGVGMIIRAEPVVKALRTVKPRGQSKISVLMSPSGELLSQKKVEKLAQFSDIVVVCPRYEGVDERVRDYIDLELSIGDYVIHSGDTAGLVLIEAVARLKEGFMTSGVKEELSVGLLGFPQYTVPREFEGKSVPDVLLSGHHAKIRRWRIEMSAQKTVRLRPDLVLRVLVKIKRDVGEGRVKRWIEKKRKIMKKKEKAGEIEGEIIAEADAFIKYVCDILCGGKRNPDTDLELANFIADYFETREFEKDPFLQTE